MNKEQYELIKEELETIKIQIHHLAHFIQEIHDGTSWESQTEEEKGI